MRRQNRGDGNSLIQVAAAVVGAAAASQTSPAPSEHRAGGHAPADDEAEHWRAAIRRLEAEADALRTVVAELERSRDPDVHAALNTYETHSPPGVRHTPTELSVIGANGRRLIVWPTAEGVWVGGSLITEQVDAEALGRYIIEHSRPS